MNQPTVCAICLTADRPELAKRAVECFRKQTYPHKRLLIWDSGEVLCPELEAEDDGVYWVPVSIESGIRSGSGETIGHLRNLANAFWSEYPIIAHWDSDDWSHPARIAEQVALLESSGAEAVGYNDLIFWRDSCELQQGAWIYKGTVLGTSLAYWRATWERNQFKATSYGEDTHFINRVKCIGVSSIAGDEPRMVARIHKGNTSKAYDVRSMLAAPNHWQRKQEWDQYAKSVCSR